MKDEKENLIKQHEIAMEEFKNELHSKAKDFFKLLQPN